MTNFTVCNWRAWAPGLGLTDDRILDFSEAGLPERVPKLLQRRLSPLAKAVFNVAELCLEQGKTSPVVFSSTHGEICKSLVMLQTIQAGQELSPTAFSLSVHNAIAGLFSIAFHNSHEITVVAPGQEGIAPAFIEALGMLQEGADEVLLILYDEPIADFYPTAPFNLTAPFSCVLGLKLAFTGNGQGLKLIRSRQSRADGEQPVQLPVLIRFLLSEDKLLRLGNQGHCWTWQKN